MATQIPDKYKDLVSDGNPLGMLGTVMADGSPQVTPVWFDYEGGKVRFNTARGRVKDHNLARDPKVAFTIVDPKNPYRYVQIRGNAREVAIDASAHIDKLALKYLGKEKYPFAAPNEVRVAYEIEAASVSGNG